MFVVRNHVDYTVDLDTSAGYPQPRVRITVDGERTGRRQLSALVYRLAAQVEAFSPDEAAWVVVPDVRAGTVRLELVDPESGFELAMSVLEDAVKS